MNKLDAKNLAQIVLGAGIEKCRKKKATQCRTLYLQSHNDM